MNQNPPSPSQSTTYLTRPEGRIAYDVSGNGPLVVLVPGMGDLRSTYRFIAPILREAGYRVACTDLRGHGDSDATFSSYGDGDTATDIAALIDALGGPAVVVGNSMAAGAAVLVAADRPELINGLVLVGPFVRNAQIGWLQRVLLRLAIARPWAATAWKAYLPTLYSGRKPVDFDDYRRQVAARLHQPGHTTAFRLTTRTDHDPAEARLAAVAAPVVVIMGELDPDFPDPGEEADWIATALHAEVVMVPDAGHYPQSQRPDLTTDAVLSFLGTVVSHA